MFRSLASPGQNTVTVRIEDREVTVPEGQSVAAAVLAAGIGHVRLTPVTASPRAPYCLMGICFDCLMEIDGEPNVQSCLRQVRDGMVIRRQLGPPKAAQ